MSPIPLFGALPGAPEMLVMLLLMVLLGVPVLIIALVAVVGMNLLGDSSDDRTEELEQELQKTRAELEDLRTELEETDSPHADDGT